MDPYPANESRGTGLVSRWWRLLWPGRNPLARRGDRLEARLAVGLALLVLLAVPFAASLGSETYADRLAQASRDARTKHAVTAKLVAEPAVTVGIGEVHNTHVLARWRLPDGTYRTGEVPVSAAARKGDAIMIWTDRAGEVTTPPVTTTGAATDAVTVGVTTWLVVLTACGLVFVAVRAVLARHRSLQWAREWERVEREWSRR